jgi:SAM-dependent methyltransferase
MENAMHDTTQTTTEPRYVFDQRRHDERERLAAMERLWDPGTQAVVKSLGIILNDHLPEAHFDLVHARLVMEHLGPRSLEPAASAVRPGGWLVLEDYGWGATLTHPEHDRMRQVMDGVTRIADGGSCTSSSAPACRTSGPTGACASTAAQAQDRRPVDLEADQYVVDELLLI